MVRATPCTASTLVSRLLYVLAPLVFLLLMRMPFPTDVCVDNPRDARCAGGNNEADHYFYYTVRTGSRGESGSLRLPKPTC